MKLRITVEGRTYDVQVEILEGDPAHRPNGNGYHAQTGRPTTGHGPAVQPVSTPMPAPASSAAPEPPSDNAVVAPLPGTVNKIAVKVGDAVKQGDTIVILDSMKVELTVAAHRNGTVQEIRVQPGESVTQGHTMVILGA